MCYYILTLTPFKSELKLAVKVGNLQILLFGIEMPAATSNGEIVNKMKVVYRGRSGACCVLLKTFVRTLLFVAKSVWPDGFIDFLIFGHLQQWKFAQ